MHLDNGTSIVVWYEWGAAEEGKYHIWNVEKGRLLSTMGKSQSGPSKLGILEDGSKVFVLDCRSTHSWVVDRISVSCSIFYHPRVPPPAPPDIHRSIYSLVTLWSVGYTS